MIQLHDLQFEPYIDNAAIKQRVAELGAEITQRYAGKQPVFLIVMKGAFMFAAELLQHVNLPCTLHFTKVQSYTGTKGGAIASFEGIPQGLEGKDVIIVEDIIDSGNTIAFLLPHVQVKHPASVTTVALLQKKIHRENNVHADMLAFEIPDVFVVGFGLDYNQLGRNIPAIYAVKEV